jgi:hypothetical protein
MNGTDSAQEKVPFIFFRKKLVRLEHQSYNKAYKKYVHER